MGGLEYTGELDGLLEGLGLVWKPSLFLKILLKSGSETFPVIYVDDTLQ